MANPTESEVRKIITPQRESKVDRAYSRAVTDWVENADRAKMSRWPRTRANVIFEYLANHLTEEFDSDPNARFEWGDETFRLIFDEQLLIRFKKANKNGVGSSIPTQAEIDFCNPQLDLPGMPGVQKVEISYKLNATGTAVDRINVAARNQDKPLWAYPLSGSDETGSADVIAFSPPQPPVPSIDEMVKPRTSKSDEKRKNDGKNKKGQ